MTSTSRSCFSLRSFFLVCALFLAAFFCVAALAEETRIWPFDTAGDYSLFKENGGQDTDGSSIAIEDGKVKLVPESSATGDWAVETLRQGEMYGVKVGASGAIQLAKGETQYVPQGTYTSRIFDGGGTGNIWKRMSMENTSVPLPASGAVPVDSSDPFWGQLVFVAHYDADYTDSVNDIGGENYGGSTARVITDSIIGDGALYTGNRGIYYPEFTYPATAGSIQDVTVSAWVKRTGTVGTDFGAVVDTDHLVNYELARLS